MKKTVPLKKNYEYRRIYKKGSFFVGRFIILYVLQNGQELNRIGVTISKKVGKSVKRNRIRRIVKENYRFYEEFVKNGYDCVFIVRSSDKEPGFHEIRREIKYLLKKLNVFNQERWLCQKT
jgi:ribonuclease P protein component